MKRLSMLFVLLCLLFAGLLVSCGAEEPTPPLPQTPTPPAAITHLIEDKTNAKGYVIVCDKDDTTANRRAIQLRAILDAACGAKLSIVDDSEAKGKYEIAVMQTSRDISTQLKTQVLANGAVDDLLWGFSFDGECFAVYASSDAAWDKCMKEFSSLYISDGRLTVTKELTLHLSCVTRAEYDLELKRKQTYLDPIFTDHAVLQHGREVILYGTGIGHVSVELLGETYEGVTDEESETFTVTLPPTPAGGPYTLTVNIEGTETVLRDILFGEVILLAGQSNAELPLDQTDTAAEEYESNTRVRTYFVGQHFTEQFHYTTPLDNRWATLYKSEAADWCAIAYHLGLKIEDEQNIPVGVICVVRGATVIQSFMSPESQAEFDFSPSELGSAHPCNTTVDRYKCFNTPGMMYDKLFCKITPYTVGSVVWYQGESNDGSGESKAYDKLLAAMISLWRTDLKNDELPFIIVKLHDRNQSAGWLAVREAQERAARDIPYCTLVDLDSLGVCTDIHPKNKAAVCDLIYDAYYAGIYGEK